MEEHNKKRKMEKIMDAYSNRDFYLSSYLIAAGEPLKSYRKTNGITTFEFDNSDKLQDLVQEYYSMNAFVNAMQYGSAIKNLKSVLHSDTNTKSNNKNESRILCK